MLDGCAATAKPTFNCVEDLRREGFEKAEAEGLGDGRVGTIENNGRAADLVQSELQLGNSFRRAMANCAHA